MKAFDIQEHKFLIAQKYKIPESEIDESVLTLYLLIDSMNEESKQLNRGQQKAINQALQELKEYQARKFQAITYEDPKTAFWGNLGSKGVIGVAVSLAIMVVALVFSSWNDSRELVQNLEILKRHIKVTDEGYFIDHKSYTVVKGGILIKP